MYVGETERSLKAKFSEHQRPSSTTSEVSKHIHVDHLQHSVELENTEVLTIEPWTQASTEMEEGTIYHWYGTSSRTKWRQTGEEVGVGCGGGLIMTVPHNVPNNIADTSKLKMLTDVGESFCELNFISQVLSVEVNVWFQDQDRWAYIVI